MSGYGNFFGSGNNAASGQPQNDQGQPNPLEGNAQPGQNQGQPAQNDANAGNNDGQTNQGQYVDQAQYQHLQQQLEQERQWKQQMGRFLMGQDPHATQFNQQQTNEQIAQLLQQNPAQLFNNLNNGLQESTKEMVSQQVAQALAVNQADSHFKQSYPHMAQFHDVVELEAQKVVAEVQQKRQQGYNVDMTPTQAIDEAVRRTEQRLQSLNSQQNQTGGNPYAMSSFDMGGMNNQAQQQQKPTQDYWSMSPEDFGKAKAAIMRSSYA